jgi:hypothetical protein
VITVTQHAVERAIQRRLYPQSRSIAERIREDVEQAWKSGRKHPFKPKWALLYKERQRILADGQWYVYTECKQRGFYVKTEPEIVVITAMNVPKGAS